MKALFFVNSLGNGGAERVCVNIGKTIKTEGGEVDFITLFNNQEYSGFLPSRHLCLHLDPSASKIEIIFNILKRKAEIDRFIGDAKAYDLITAHLPLSHICASISKCGKKSLYVQHISLKSEGKFYWLYRQFYKNKRNVCVSKGLSDEFVNVMNYKPEYVHTIYNPINCAEISNVLNEDFQFDRPYILCVGRLCQQKRFDRAIDAFYQGGFFHNYDLVILGKGEQKAVLEERVEKYGIEDKVHFKGWVNNVYTWMKHSALLLQTSEREAFPMVLIEALSSGARIVASDCPYGAEEILLGDLSEYIAHQDDIQDYIQKIQSALSSYPDVKNCTIVKKCSDKQVLNNYMRVYSNHINDVG